MSVGWEVKLYPVSRITIALALKRLFHLISMKSKHVSAARDTLKFFWNEVFWFWHCHWSTSKWLQFGLSHIIQVSISWDKHFLLVSRYLSLWPWPFLKSFTIGGICVLQTHRDCYDNYIKISSFGEGTSTFLNEGPRLFPSGDNYKNLPLQNHSANSTILSAQHP